MDDLNNINLESPKQTKKVSNFASDHKNQGSAETKLSLTKDLLESSEFKDQDKNMENDYLDLRVESAEKLNNPNKRVMGLGVELTPDPTSSYQKKGK